MVKPLSKSQALASKVMFAALCLLRDRGAAIKAGEILDALEKQLLLDDWALEVIESNGLPRWRMYAHFFSVDAVKAGFLTKERGMWSLTSGGAQALMLGEQGYFLKAQQGYKAWKAAQLADSGNAKVRSELAPGVEVEEAPPEVRFEALRREVNSALAAEVLERVKSCSPVYFERLVVQLLIRMGYGGSREEAGQAVGRSGDGGIDGIINEDRLGLDAIYLQAKRWEGSVGEGPVRDFKGALDAKGAQKGVFITTSSYTPAAKEAARTSRSYKIVLIDGARLAELMIEHDLGVSVTTTYQLKRIDSDFFSEE